MPLKSSDPREPLCTLSFVGILSLMLISFPDYREKGGFPSIKLAVYSNIQCQL